MPIPSDETRKAARELLKELGLNQTKISNRINVSQAALSSFFTANHTQNNTSIKVTKKILDNLDEEIKKQENISETKNNLTCAKILLEKISLDLGFEGYSYKVAPPGTLITTLDEKVNILRDADERLLEYITNNKANLVFIDGGNKSGRTSSLKKIDSHSDEESTHSILIDFEKIKDEDCVLSYLCAGIIEDYYHDESPIEGNNIKPEDHQNAMIEYFEKVLSDDNQVKKVNLLLDNIDHLGLEQEQEEQNKLLSWLLRLSEDFAGSITIFIVFSGSGWSSITRSSIKTRGPTVLLEPFSIEQVIKLLEVYSQDLKLAEIIFNYSLGQPYITHIIIDSISMGISLEKVLDVDSFLRGNLLSHWEIVKRELHKEYSNNLHILINILKQIINSDFGEGISITGIHGITQDIGEPLFTRFCMLNGAPNDATVAGFFRHAISHDAYWIDELEDSNE